MSDDNYKIDVEIATDQARKAVKDLESAISKFEKSTAKATKTPNKEFGEIEDAIEDVGKSAKKHLPKAADEVEKLGKSAKKAGDSGSGGFKSIGDSFSVFQGVLAGGIALKAIEGLTTAATALFRTFIIDGVRAASVQQDAINKLATSMLTAGDYSKEAVSDIIDFAAGIQRITKFGDEAVIAQVALAKSFGATNEQAKLVVDASIELAAAQGKTLQESVRQVSKTLGGFAGELGEVNPAIKNLTAAQLKNGEAARVLIEQYRGSATGEINTFSGAVTQAGNAFGDLQEAIGGFVTKNPQFISLVQKSTKVLLDFAGAISTKAIQRFGTEAEKAAVNVEPLNKKLVEQKEKLAELNSQLSETDSWYARMENKSVKFKINLQKLQIEDTERALARYNVALEEQAKKEDEIAKKQASRPKAQGPVALGDEGNFAKRLAEENKSLESAYALRNEQLKLQKEQDLITEDEYQIERLNLLSQRKVEEEAIIQAALDTRQVSEKTYRTALLQLDNNYQRQIIQSQQEVTRQTKKELEERTKKEKQEKQTQSANLKSSLAYTASLMNESSKELFAIGKAAALANAFIDGQAAVVKALASAPPPFNFALAAAVGVAAAANIAKIASARPGSSGTVSAPAGNFPSQSQQDVKRLDLQIAENEQKQSNGDDSQDVKDEIARLNAERDRIKKQLEIDELRAEVGKYATGGIVPGNSTVGDNVRANVNSGEMILNRTQQKQLFEVANGGGKVDNAKLDRAIGLLTQAVNQPISIQIDGREIVNVTRTQLANGRTL